MPTRILSFSSLVCACLVVAFATLGCGDKKAGDGDKGDASSSIEKAEKSNAKAPKIDVAEATFNFGTVKQGTNVEHVFKVKNTGEAELKIERARGS